MSFSARIDSVTVDGELIVVSRTEGEMPLSLTPQGEVADFPTRAACLATIKAGEEIVAANLWLVRLGKAYKADPTFGPVFIATAKAAPHALLDLTGLASTITP